MKKNAKGQTHVVAAKAELDPRSIAPHEIQSRGQPDTLDSTNTFTSVGPFCRPERKTQKKKC